MKRDSILPVALLGMSFASGVNAWLFELGRRTGADFVVPHGEKHQMQQLDVLDVMLVTIVAMMVGSAVYALLTQWVPRHARVLWAAAALLAFAASFIPFLEIVEPSTKFWLSLMHMSPVVALFIVLRMTAQDV